MYSFYGLHVRHPRLKLLQLICLLNYFNPVLKLVHFNFLSNHLCCRIICKEKKKKKKQQEKGENIFMLPRSLNNKIYYKRGVKWPGGLNAATLLRNSHLKA